LFFFIFAFKTEYSILVINILSFISTSHPLYISDPSKQTNRGAHSSFSPFFTHPTPPPPPPTSHSTPLLLRRMLLYSSSTPPCTAARVKTVKPSYRRRWRFFKKPVRVV
jgi:hypothetical protein